MYKLHHFSDPHFSFNEDGSIQKPMDQRTWSKGTPAYIDYITRIMYYQNKIDDLDIQVITGDITHDMPKSKVKYSLMWIDNNLRGKKIVIRGNHDRNMKIAELRMTLQLKNTYLMDEGEILSVGPYMFGCWSEHVNATQADGENHIYNHEELYNFAWALSLKAKDKNKIPVLLSHYPCPLPLADELGKLGLKVYLHGHIHCTNNQTGDEDGVDWTWYMKSAAHTDDKTINGCFFSCGTTDVLKAKHGIIVKQIYLPEAKARYQKMIAEDNLQVNKKKFDLKVILLVGIPGSGKSQYAASLRDTYKYTIISQDANMGNKKKTMEQFRQALNRGENIVVDRTNFNKSQRKAFINLAKEAGARVQAIVFRVPEEVCIARVLARKDHPTTGKIPDFAKVKLVNAFTLLLQEPGDDEGFDFIGYST